MADEGQDIARRLQELRVWRRKSLKVIAELAGITEGYLSRLESGHRRLDKRSTIAALAAALEVSPSELIGQPVRWEDPAMAEAQAARRGWEYDAVSAFQRSEKLAALRLRSNIYAREAVTGLLPRVRRDTSAGRELRGIAYRMGLTA